MEIPVRDGGRSGVPVTWRSPPIASPITPKPGRSRYALLLNERGHVMDDGMILRDSETRFVLSFTDGGAADA